MLRIRLDIHGHRGNRGISDGSVPQFLVKSKQRPKAAFVSSAILHCWLLFLIIRFPILTPYFIALSGPVPMAPDTRHAQVIYYDLKTGRLAEPLPNIKSPGHGSRPGLGNRPEKLPALGSSEFYPRVSVTVNSPDADNFRQLILQPASPPELKINSELRLPDVVATVPTLAPQAVIEIRRGERLTVAKIATKPVATNVSSVAAPEMAIAMQPATSMPHLPIAPTAPAALAKTEATTSSGGGSGQAQTGTGTAGLPEGLAVLSVNPGPLRDLVSLPPGNRHGSFSVSSAGAKGGSPGGDPGGVIGGGEGGNGRGGNGSTVIGRGNGGGGGGGNGDGVGRIGIDGGSGAGGGLRGGVPSEPLALAANVALIFPVISPPHVRKSSFLLYTGPVGGGGLDEYGALTGNKIYTIFLPMPGSNWILQYCVSDNASPTPKPQDKAVQFRETVAPPDAIERFDFKRPAVPPLKQNKMIVLRGTILQDGSVTNLKVYRSVQPDVDALAAGTFRRWKFSPALKGREPVAVDILVGIPVAPPRS